MDADARERRCVAAFCRRSISSPFFLSAEVIRPLASTLRHPKSDFAAVATAAVSANTIVGKSPLLPPAGEGRGGADIARSRAK